MSFWKGKRVIVTGAAGILGQNLVRRLLNEGSIVYAFTYKKRKLHLLHDNLYVVSLDLKDYEDTLKKFKLVKADVLLNCAAVIKGAKGQKTGQLFLVRDNVTIGVNVITAAVEAEIPKFGFVGSSTMYPPKDFVTEEEGFIDDPWKGYSGVGNMKRYLEKVCMQFHNESNTKFAIARTTALYGPYDDFNLETCHVIPALINKIVHKLDPLEVWGKGDEIRNFVYVEDFIDGFLLMIENKCDADPVNITNGSLHSVKDVIDICVDLINYNPVINYDATKPTMIPKRLVSVQKAKDILNWEASVALYEGLKKTIEWYKENYE